MCWYNRFEKHWSRSMWIIEDFERPSPKERGREREKERERESEREREREKERLIECSFVSIFTKQTKILILIKHYLVIQYKNYSLAANFYTSEAA
jgi:hypothetical protein